MKIRIGLRAGLPTLVCAAAFCATEVWNTKDPSVWTTEDINTILNNSPWAKQIKVGGQQMGQRRGMGRRGGMGYPGGGYPGGGYPGGGGRGGGGSMPMSALIRWESAQTVQQAEARLKNLNAPSDAKAAEGQADGKPEAKVSDHYVVELIGLRPPGSRYRNNDDDNSDRRSTSTQARDQLMTYTQLVIKNKAPIGPDDVKIDNQSGQNEIRFFFPKSSPITAADKEVTFHTMIGNQKVENKFELKKMTRNGRLELD